MIIACQMTDCPAVIEVQEPAQSARYTCRHHTRPAEDSVRFQDSQFDPQIGAGTDPKSYERGSTRFGRSSPTIGKIRSMSEAPKSYKKRVIEQAKLELIGHENSKEILRLLNLDVRDANSGTTKNK